MNGLVAALCFTVAVVLYSNCDLFLDKHEKRSQETPLLCTREGKRMFIELTLLMALISVAYILLGYKCIVGVRKVRYDAKYEISLKCFKFTLISFPA